MNAQTTEDIVGRTVPRDKSRILGDCRDIAIHRLLLSFTASLDRVSDMLMDRAGRTDVREEQQNYLDARDALTQDRTTLMAEFERLLRAHLDDRIAGKVTQKTDFSKLDGGKLTLVDTDAMDEAVITSNIVRIVENLCYEELLLLNRGMGQLLGDPELETARNPFAPVAIVDAFSEALDSVKAEHRVKSAILKELNQASLSEINGIYADLNKHLQNLRVLPAGARPHLVKHRPSSARAKSAEGADNAGSGMSSGEIDVMALFRRKFGQDASRTQAQGMMPGQGVMHGMSPQGMPWQGGVAPEGGGAGGAGGIAADAEGHPGTPIQGGGAIGGGGLIGGGLIGGGGIAGGGGPVGVGGVGGGVGGDFPPISLDAGARYIPVGPLAPTPSGYVPGQPIIATPMLGEGLARLQAGESGFDLGGGTVVHFSGIPAGKHNVLRDLQESPLGKKVNQLESMTIELVAMLFDFIFETKDLPDGIKALLARLQIPVLKAAMLDGAFFAKKSHPARLLVNALAEAGLGWSPEMGTADPLYSHIDALVHRILDGFTNDLAIFDEAREKLVQFLAEEEKTAEANIQSSAEEINQHDRLEMATAVAKAEIERRIEMYPIPNFLATFLRQHWAVTLENVYLKHGEDGEAWEQSIALLEDLVWSVQPKRTRDDRQHLVALLPSLLKRLANAMDGLDAAQAERSRFMANLVEAHAASVKPGAGAGSLVATAAVAEQAKADAEEAKAAGDEAKAAQAEELAVAMTQAEPAPVEEPPEMIEEQYLEIAQSVERGAWMEFEADDGQLAFAKLAWISPLRGTYLFTNRQGLKALSMNAEELAERFRTDRARLVEAEPLLDRAFGSVMATFAQTLPEPVAQ